VAASFAFPAGELNLCHEQEYLPSGILFQGKPAVFGFAASQNK
jgi:hypothetical protein